MKAGATKHLVLDASVAIAWCFEDEHSKVAEAVLDLLADGTEMIVPGIWPLEVANAMLMAERRERITHAQAVPLLQRISKLPIMVEAVTTTLVFEQALSAAREYELTVYDACYLALAMAQAIPLATLDNRLRQAARSAGISLLQ